MTQTKASKWIVCKECEGTGKVRRELGKTVQLRYRKACEQFEASNGEGTPPVRPNGAIDTCDKCKGKGLVSSATTPQPNPEYPHIAIIGGGIGGVALAVACLHRGIPFTLYERDSGFDVRSQGYGLTLQQASNAIKGLGLLHLKESLHSTRHVVHDTNGKVIIEWGMRISKPNNANNSPKRTNVHVPRQTLRLALLEQLGGNTSVQWGHQLIDLIKKENNSVELKFKVNDETKIVRTDLVVGADGIYSSVRRLVIGEHVTPLRYLGLIVILGICPLEQLKGFKHHLLDSATVFQSSNGSERMYMMPYSENVVMWQFSFPMPEEEAKALSEQGAKALKEEACRRTPWHDPIPQILSATLESQISGYPVYDRDLLHPDLLLTAGSVTLLGDAAHPMSPFKGQGANQALLDTLLLARNITKNCGPNSNWREIGLRKIVLTDYESEMLRRSAVKVKDSAEAAQLLHSEKVLRRNENSKKRSLK